MHQYHVDSGWPGTVLASTTELEAGRLAPALILQKSHEEVARKIARAVDSGDDISSVRLNDIRAIAYTTAAGADIIVRKQLCIICHSSSYEPLIYTGPPILPPSADMDVLMNFTKGVMGDIGYSMDGSEWIDAVDFGSRAEITVRQKAGGWILPGSGSQL